MTVRVTTIEADLADLRRRMARLCKMMAVTLIASLCGTALRVSQILGLLPDVSVEKQVKPHVHPAPEKRHDTGP